MDLKGEYLLHPKEGTRIVLMKPESLLPSFWLKSHFCFSVYKAELATGSFSDLYVITQIPRRRLHLYPSKSPLENSLERVRLGQVMTSIYT